MITFLIVGIPFIIVGYLLKAASDRVVENVVQYDGAGTDPTVFSACHIDTGTLPVSSKINIA